MPLPPLKSLRYFVTAARHKSLTKAAEELHVTHSAISHQLKGLEDWLGQPLFRRAGRRLELTDSGTQILPDLERAFRQMEEALERVRPGKKPLVVTTLPSLAAKWLVPRLSSFRQAHPGIDVHLSTIAELEDIAHGAADIAIRYGAGQWQDLEASFLCHAGFFPVCAPSFLQRYGMPKTPADILNFPLLGDPDIRGRGEETWRAWFKLAGVTDVDLDISLHFDTNALMLQAAMDGLGIGLSNQLLGGDDLRAGRLVQLFDIVLQSQFSYYLVHRPQTDKRVQAFSHWIAELMKGYQ